jgi:hypothetical protein
MVTVAWYEVLVLSSDTGGVAERLVRVAVSQPLPCVPWSIH